MIELSIFVLTILLINCSKENYAMQYYALYHVQFSDILQHNVSETNI